MTSSQYQAIDEFWPSFGFDGLPLNFPSPQAPLIVEIGFGNGLSLLNQARLYPDTNFLGIEVHRPGVGIFLKAIAEAGLENIRVSKQDAVEVLALLPDQSLEGVQIFFPDPWQKRRHHKRRLIQPHFIAQLLPKLKSGGFIHVATDWGDYARQILRVLSAEAQLHNTSPTGTTIPRPAHRIVSKFEKRGIELGHPVWDYYFIKRAHPPA